MVDLNGREACTAGVIGLYLGDSGHSSHSSGSTGSISLEGEYSKYGINPDRSSGFLSDDFSFDDSIVDSSDSVAQDFYVECAELNSSLEKRANTTWKVYMCVIILDILVVIGIFFLGILNLKVAAGIITIILVVLDFIFEAIAYIMYITFLAKARKEV